MSIVVKDRGSILHYVNAAYTSQMDSETHCLEGRRVSDKFYHVSGAVSHADVNAACNIKHRFYLDKEISLYTPYLKVKEILLNRLHASEELVCLHCVGGWPPLQDSSYVPEMDINRERINLKYL